MENETKKDKEATRIELKMFLLQFDPSDLCNGVWRLKIYLPLPKEEVIRLKLPPH